MNTRELFEQACYDYYLQQHAAGKTEDAGQEPMTKDRLMWRTLNGTYGVLSNNAAWWGWETAAGHETQQLQYATDMRRHRDLLGKAIGEAAIKAGIYNGEVDVAGPHLLMLADEMAEHIIALAKSREVANEGHQEMCNIVDAMMSTASVRRDIALELFDQAMGAGVGMHQGIGGDDSAAEKKKIDECREQIAAAFNVSEPASPSLKERDAAAITELHAAEKRNTELLSEVKSLSELLDLLDDAVSALDGTSVENEALVDRYRARKGEHTLYETRDGDAPKCITDSNGEVVLSLCRVCGLGEAQLLDTPCRPKP